MFVPLVTYWMAQTVANARAMEHGQGMTLPATVSIHVGAIWSNNLSEMPTIVNFSILL